MLKEKTISFPAKLLIVLMVTIIGFASGSSLTVLYARHHHKIAGVDYPHNASAYYNPTTPDYADDPSTYALRDLAANAGNVIDYTRLAKNILNTEAIPPWIKAFVQKSELYKKMSKPLDKTTVMHFEQDTSTLNELSDRHKPQGEFDVSAFESSGEDGYFNSNNYDAQMKAINTIYDDAITRYAAIDYDQQAYIDAADRALDAALHADGEREVQDAMNQLRMIQATQAKDKQLLLQEAGRMRGIDAMRQQASERAAQEVVRNSSQNILDPSDPNDKAVIDSMVEQSGVKPYESIGMPDFQ